MKNFTIVIHQHVACELIIVRDNFEIFKSKIVCNYKIGQTLGHLLYHVR